MFSEENVHFSLNGITALSALVTLDQGYPAGEGPPGWFAPKYQWIKFEITTHLRVGTNGVLRNVDFGSALTDALAADIKLIETLQSELELADELTVLEITPFEEEVVSISAEGGVSGKCSLIGCQCEYGFILIEDGSCAINEQTIPTASTTTKGTTTEATTTEATTTEATTTETTTTEGTTTSATTTTEF